MVKRFVLIFVGVGVAALLLPGCADRHLKRQFPPYAYPPEMIPRVAWSERLPGGSARAQKPSRVAICVLDDTIDDRGKAIEFLRTIEKESMRLGGGDLPQHIYMDGSGKLYEGRSIFRQSPSLAGIDPEGTVWICILDRTINIFRGGGPTDTLVHLVAFLCYSYGISPESVQAYPMEEGVYLRLVEDLNGPFLRSEVNVMLMRAPGESTKPSADSLERSRRLRVDEASE